MHFYILLKTLQSHIVLNLNSKTKSKMWKKLNFFNNFIHSTKFKNWKKKNQNIFRYKNEHMKQRKKNPNLLRYTKKLSRTPRFFSESVAKFEIFDPLFWNVIFVFFFNGRTPDIKWDLLAKGSGTGLEASASNSEKHIDMCGTSFQQVIKAATK